MIIGVTGSYGAGKDTVADFLQKMNFYHVSFSDLLREELQLRGESITRDALIAVGNELRQKSGGDILARKALHKLKDGENYVFTSIRSPAEVECLQQRQDFMLLHVAAPEHLRLQRLQGRNREGDPLTLEEMREKEALENTSDPYSQQLQRVAQMAQATIINDQSLEKLQQQVENLVREHLYTLRSPRPDWDIYFMSIAEQVKLRCTCLSAKKGAIIVKDKMIISTGYSGTPKGIRHCTDGGCRRCTSRHLGKMKSGVYEEPCICCHSEENAIVQAAYNGVSSKGATMYTTFTPCVTCAKMIINAGIKEVIAKVVYPDDAGTQLLQEGGVKLRVLP